MSLLRTLLVAAPALLAACATPQPQTTTADRLPHPHRFHRVLLAAPGDWDVSANPDAPADADQLRLFSPDGRRTVFVTISTPKNSTAPEDFVRTTQLGAMMFVQRLMMTAPHLGDATVFGSGEGASPFDGDLYGRKGVLLRFTLMPEGAKSEADGQPLMRVAVFGQLTPDTHEVLSIVTAVEDDPGGEVEAVVRSVQVLPR